MNGESKKEGFVTGIRNAVILIILFVYLYVTLKSEDYALLLGSLGLFCVLALVMFVTRKINWNEIILKEQK